MRYSTSTRHELFPMLCTCRHNKVKFAIEGLQHCVHTKCSLSNRQRQCVHQVIIHAFKVWMCCHSNMDIQITCGATTRAHRTSVGKTQCLPRANAGRYINCVGLFRHHATVTRAHRTRRHDDLPHSPATATWASGNHLTQHALSHAPHLTKPTTFSTLHRLGSCSCTGAFA
ncbi:unannotated protein [freshwater metagenome]|uniref:Unannotated protein n=1 Tax=freshwater metagenome TaxID=449393 RepID=A0A6J6LMG7_9ZZZZ